MNSGFHLRRRHIQGLTLIELMVALALSLVLLAALIALVTSTISNRNELDKSSYQVENGRYALQALGEDIEMAGFVGMVNPQAFSRTAAPAALCPDDKTTLAQLGYNAAARQLPLALQAQATAPSCISNAKAGTGMLLITRVSSIAQAPSTVTGSTDEMFMQASACPKDLLRFAVAYGGSDAFTLRQRGSDDNCTSAALAPVRKVVQRIYFINNTEPPTLNVAEYVKSATRVVPLVDGIEGLQFDFGVDTDGDGAPDSYTTTPADWNGVMAVRIHVLARSINATGGWKDTRTYDMGLSGAVGPFNDGYKRSVYSTVVRLNNLAGPKEQP